MRPTTKLEQWYAVAVTAAILTRAGAEAGGGGAGEVEQRLEPKTSWHWACRTTGKTLGEMIS